ncbi:ribonuclease HII [Nocardioides montaniterrae]
MSRSKAPSLRIERQLLRDGHTIVAGVDEVGRGALCGPVTVAIVTVDLATRTAPQGVRDSKLLSAEVRTRLAPKIMRWASSYGVGHASAAEIDALGIIAAMRLAGHRAIGALQQAPDLILLDGNHDYLTPPVQDELFPPAGLLAAIAPVRTLIKADLKCAAVAAASILAKTARDAILVELAGDHPAYGWAENKGYSAPEHIAALAEHGPTPHHRTSWSLPGLVPIEPLESPA